MLVYEGPRGLSWLRSRRHPAHLLKVEDDAANEGPGGLSGPFLFVAFRFAVTTTETGEENAQHHFETNDTSP